MSRASIMGQGLRLRTRAFAGAVIAVAGLFLTAAPSAQRGRGAPPQAPRAIAPVDLTGTWVSLVTEDWRWRMVTPRKGDYASVPLNPEGRRVADEWDPAKDIAAGEQCRAYGAPAVMRVPGRVRISWENDTTLRIDTDAGTQTRLLTFGRPPAEPVSERTWQGRSTASWEFAGGVAGGSPPRGGSLKVVTTALRPGYLRKNGVPYSANAVLTEFFNRVTDLNGASYLVVTTMVEDPQFLAVPRWVTSSHFKKEADDSKWSPTPCSAS